MNYQNFSSLPPAEEQSFVVFERRMDEVSKKSTRIAAIGAGAFLLFVLVIVFSFGAPDNFMAGEDMGMLTREEDKTAAEPIKQPPAAESAEAVADEPEAEEPADEDGE